MPFGRETWCLVLGLLVPAGCGGAFELVPNDGSAIDSPANDDAQGRGDASTHPDASEDGTTADVAVDSARDAAVDTSPDGCACLNDSGAPPDSGVIVTCPAAPPPDLAPCPRVGMVCEYGSDPRSACNQHVRCVTGSGSSPAWKSDPLPPCSVIPPGMCPATEAAAKSLASCVPNGSYCFYGDDTCVCAQCNGPCMVMPRFTCYGPPTSPGCPKKKPDIGTSCPGPAQCVYGSCASGITECDCTGGYWTDNPVACAL